VHIDERNDNGGYEAESHTATNIIVAQSYTAKAKNIFYQHRPRSSNTVTHRPWWSITVACMSCRAHSILGV